MTLDASLFRAANSLFPSAVPLWTLLNDPAAALLLVAVALLVLWSGGSWRWAIPALVAVMVSDVVTSHVIKPAVGRERPCAVAGEVYAPLVNDEPHCGVGSSMPSAHAANSMALGTVLASPALVGVSLVVGVARVVGGQHWPSDVAAGWALGLAIGWAVRAALERALKWQ